MNSKAILHKILKFQKIFFAKNNYRKYVIITCLFFIFISFFSCLTNTNQQKDMVSVNNMKLNEDDIKKDFYNTINTIDIDLSSNMTFPIEKVELDSELQIVSSMPVNTPAWIKDTWLWIDQDKDKNINIVFEREDESLAAAKRLAENDIKSKIDSNLKTLLETEIRASFQALNINDENFFQYIKFEIKNMKFVIIQYFKEYYWQYLNYINKGQIRAVYRYYIYLKFPYKYYYETRNQFFQKISNQKPNYKIYIEAIINNLNSKN